MLPRNDIHQATINLSDPWPDVMQACIDALRIPDICLAIRGGQDGFYESLTRLCVFLESESCLPLLANLTGLTFTGSKIGGQGARILAQSPALNNITYLDLAWNKICDDGVRILAQSSIFDKLNYLDLGGNEISEEGVAALADSLYFLNLTTLKLSYNKISDSAMEALARMPCNLTVLHWRNCEVSLTGMRVLIDSPHLINLAELDLGYNQIGDEVVALLSQSSLVTKLVDLSLCGGNISEVGVRALMKTSRPCRLARLDLGLNPIGDAGAKELAKSKLAGNLTHLNMCCSQISAVGVRALAKSPHLVNLVSLNLRGNQLNDTDVRTLAQSHMLTNLITLDLGGTQIGDTGLSALAKSQHLDHLSELLLSNNLIGDVGVRALAQSPIMSNLTRLDVHSNQIGSAGIQALVRFSCSEKLVHLELGSNQIGETGVRALATWPSTSGLNHLGLEKNSIGDAGVRALVESPFMHNLAALYLADNQISAVGARSLVESRFLSSIKHLYLSLRDNDQISAAGIRALAESRSASAFIGLDVSNCSIGSDGVRALSESRYLGRLTSIVLSGNQIDDNGARTLALSHFAHGLTSLDVSENEITDRGAKTLLECFKKLDSVTFPGNNLSAPNTVCYSAGGLWKFYKISEFEKQRPSPLIRTLFIGQPYVGKTTLFEALIGRYQGLGFKARTQGFNRARKILNLANTTKHHGDMMLTLDMWDLGGHSLQSMIHRLFFRDNILYLLILNQDSLQQIELVQSWLEAISHRGKRDFVLPIINSRDGQTVCLSDGEIDFLLEPYRSSLNIYLPPAYISFSENTFDVEQVVTAIWNILHNFPLRTCWQVHDELAEHVEKWSDNYLSMDTFERRLRSDPQVDAICERFLSRLPAAVRPTANEFYKTAVDYLDHVGAVTVIDDEYVLLNPQWAQDGLYTLLPPEPYASEQEDNDVPAQVVSLRHQLQSCDANIRLPGVFTMDDVAPAFESKGYTASEGKALLRILSKPELGIVVDLVHAGRPNTFLMPLYLDQFPRANTNTADASHNVAAQDKESTLADAIVTCHAQADICSVIESTYWPEFILYQFMVAHWPQLASQPHLDSLKFHTDTDLTTFSRRRVRMVSRDKSLRVDLIQYNNRLWCFGYSGKVETNHGIMQMMQQIKRRLQDLIVRHDKSYRVEVKRYIPCPECMAAISVSSREGSPVLAHEHLQRLKPGAGLFLNSEVESVEQGSGQIFWCRHPLHDHPLTKSSIIRLTRISREMRVNENKSVSADLPEEIPSYDDVFRAVVHVSLFLYYTGLAGQTGKKSGKKIPLAKGDDVVDHHSVFTKKTLMGWWDIEIYSEKESPKNHNDNVYRFSKYLVEALPSSALEKLPEELRLRIKKHRTTEAGKARERTKDFKLDVRQVSGLPQSIKDSVATLIVQIHVDIQRQGRKALGRNLVAGQQGKKEDARLAHMKEKAEFDYLTKD